MNSLQHLLVAPAALGLMVPLAGVSSPTANAAELNINGVSEYASSTANSLDQVTSVTQFSDVYPTDWAYQALSNLVETYGCVAGYPNGTFRGNRAMTRYEAAALLNACLDSVTGMTDELKRLIREFETELAIIKGRVDGLEARVGELEATQFSTTTKLKGLATFATGATRFKGSATRLRSESNAVYGSTVFNTDLQLALETSFRGNDQLTTVLRAGTIGESSVFGNGGPSGLSVLETAYQADAGANALAIDKLFYAFPLADTVTITAGPLVGQEDMLAVWPSAYPSDPILDLLALNGAPGAYNKNLGAGVGLSWSGSSGLRASANYVSANGATSDISEGGFATDNAAGTGTVQLGWVADGWTVAAIYSQIQNGHDLIAYATPFTQESLSSRGVTHAFGLGGSWAPEESGWLPSVSVGWGINQSDTQLRGQVSTSQSWTLGLEWNDLFASGNNAGMAVGQPVFATDLRAGGTPADGQFIWEWWYQLQVTDNISVTPALFYLSRPMGDFTPDESTFRQLGGLIKTTFAF